MTSPVSRRELTPHIASRRVFLGRAMAGTIGAIAATSGPLSRRVMAVESPATRTAGPAPLMVHSTDPMNAEPQLAELVRSWITPVESFYIRSHAPNPQIDPATFRLSVEGLVDRPLSLSLADLAAREVTSVIATMTCAGNRRTEHSLIRPVKGVPWGAGAIGNASWSGVRLSEILKLAGIKPEAKHVWFDGLDQVPHEGGIIPFGASIPLSQAFNDQGNMPGALLTTHMNEQPLTPDHGAPLRMVVPGYIGARSVKWLGRIVVSDRPSPNHYVATAYKVVEEGTALEWDEQPPIYRFPMNSVICTPANNDQIKPGSLSVKGYAVPPGRPGSSISRIEVSADGGRSWIRASQSEAREQCWVLWDAAVPITTETRELIVRAIDSHGRPQPETIEWNQKGYLFNAWHRVALNSK